MLMKKKHILTAGIFISLLFLAACQSRQQAAEMQSPDQSNKKQITTNQASMKIASPAFEHEKNIPSAYTCDGRDINPSLQIADVPAGAKSLALIVDDPDAPVGDWVHWLIWNLKPDTKEISEDSVPAGAVQGTTDFGNPRWGGPCPPSGIHRYYFKLYALDAELNLPSSAKKKDLEKAMEGHILEQGVLMGRYSRK